MDDRLLVALNHRETEAVLLSSIDLYAEQFVFKKERNVPVLSDINDLSEELSDACTC